MTKLTADDVQRSVRRSPIQVDAQQGDAKVAAQKADLNRDGKVSGTREARALHQALDGFDKDGSSKTVKLSDGGNDTRAGTAWKNLEGPATATPTPARGMQPTEAPNITQRSGNARAGKGLETNFRQSRDITAEQLAKGLPERAKHLAPHFIEAGKKHGLDPVVLAAISKHETGNWTSNAFKNKNNAMGVSNKRGPKTFGDVGQSIDAQARSLARADGYYKNANTVRDLWGIYAPGPATGQKIQQNDPNNLNKNWGPGLAKAISDMESAAGL
jgi:hypothetical protein